MPTYDFECSVCGALDEIIQHVDAPSEKDCPVCNEKGTFRKVFLTAPTAFVKGEPTTIGQWADKNTKAMGKYEKQAKEIQDQAQKHMKVDNDKQTQMRAINRMTPEQKDRYIRTGKGV